MYNKRRFGESRGGYSSGERSFAPVNVGDEIELKESVKSDNEESDEKQSYESEETQETSDETSEESEEETEDSEKF